MTQKIDLIQARAQVAPDELLWWTRPLQLGPIPFRNRILTQRLRDEPRTDVEDQLCFSGPFEFETYPKWNFVGSKERLSPYKVTIWVKRQSREIARKYIADYSFLYDYKAAKEDELSRSWADDWDTGMWFSDVDTSAPSLGIATYADAEMYDRMLSMPLRTSHVHLSLNVGVQVLLSDVLRGGQLSEIGSLPRLTNDVDSARLGSTTAACLNDMTVAERFG